jgi:hypothetical protein
MPATLSKPSLAKLNPNEMSFVKHLIADDLWRPVVAAQKAGYKNPSQSAHYMMQKPHIAAALGREQRRRLERLQLKADEVLHLLATGLFFNPLSLFKPSAKGGWVVEDLDKIPDEIGRLIEEVKTRTVEEVIDGNTRVTTYFKVKMISKTELLRMAMKHCGIEGSSKIEHSGQVQLNLGIEGGIGQLLMNVESTRNQQIIDGSVIIDSSELTSLEEEKIISSAVSNE